MALIRVNSTPYSGKDPADLEPKPPEPTAVNANGKPVGANGYDRLIMRWGLMSETDLDWWLSYVGTSESVTLSDFVAPWPLSTSAVSGNDKHKVWGSGELHKPRITGGVHEGYGSGSETYYRDVEIEVSELVE